MPTQDLSNNFSSNPTVFFKRSQEMLYVSTKPSAINPIRFTATNLHQNCPPASCSFTTVLHSESSGIPHDPITTIHLYSFYLVNWVTVGISIAHQVPVVLLLVPVMSSGIPHDPILPSASLLCNSHYVSTNLFFLSSAKGGCFK